MDIQDRQDKAFDQPCHHFVGDVGDGFFISYAVNQWLSITCRIL